MAISQPLSPPPGFEQLTKVQQIDYVQQLWDLIVDSEGELPVPDWHLEEVRRRVDSQGDVSRSSWDDVKQRLMGKYGE
jgi:hypothetical protein